MTARIGANDQPVLLRKISFAYWLSARLLCKAGIVDLMCFATAIVPCMIVLRCV